MSAAQRRVLEALAGGCVIALADGGPRVGGGGYRPPAYWLIAGHMTSYGRRYEATRISNKTMSRLQGASLIYDYGDFGISPAGRAALAPARARRRKK